MRELYIVFMAIFVYVCILAMNWKKIEQKSLYKRRLSKLKRVNNPSQEVTNEEMNQPFHDRFVRPLWQRIVAGMTRVSPGGSNAQLKKILRTAGIRMEAAEYSAMRSMISLIATATVIFIIYILKLDVPQALLVITFWLLTLVLVIRYNLVLRVNSRKNSMSHQLPDVMDLLIVSVEAGLSFDAAIGHILTMSRGPLIDEIAILNRQISMGYTRRDAFKDLGERCDLPEINTFAAAIARGEQLGIPLKNILTAQAQQIRQMRRQQIEEKVMKLSVKIVMPLVFFVLPVLFIILLGPAVIDLVGIFGAMG